MFTINLFVKLKTTDTIKMINNSTGIYEFITPNKDEKKLIERLLKKQKI